MLRRGKEEKQMSLVNHVVVDGKQKRKPAQVVRRLFWDQKALVNSELSLTKWVC